MANEFQGVWGGWSGLREREEARFYGVWAGLVEIRFLKSWIGLSGLAHFLAHTSPNRQTERSSGGGPLLTI